MGTPEKLWNITNRPSTRTKLDLLDKIVGVWMMIWNKQSWAEKEWYIFDLFAGRGMYYDGNERVEGSPLVFLRKIAEKKPYLDPDVRIRLYLIEKDRVNYSHLEQTVGDFIHKNGLINIVTIHPFNADCNEVISEILPFIDSAKKPLFMLIDPTGLQIKKSTIESIVRLKNPKDILLNFIMEGVKRTSGIARKESRGEGVSKRELKTIQTLKEFVGHDVDVISKRWIEILESYVEVFTSRGMKIVGYDVKYPNREDVLYYLLFAVRKTEVADVVADIYVKQKTKESGSTLFNDKEFYIDSILRIAPTVHKIQRKSLLYQSKVEYGSWTINHVTGCTHGCAFPCYAMMMAKRFGWVKDEADWRIPRIAENALDILEAEILKYRPSLDFVHLCFMTDPFMYDFPKRRLIPEIKQLTLKIIERLNREGIKVTTLTKGVCPKELLDTERFLHANEYGITLVSLNNEFKDRFERYSAPYEDRIESLQRLAEAGLNTWVSMEPYPIPELDPTAKDIERILERIGFVKKIIFGKLNYNKIVPYGGEAVSQWKNNREFYEHMSQRVRVFCEANGITYHIKTGTPGAGGNSRNLFRDNRL